MIKILVIYLDEGSDNLFSYSEKQYDLEDEDWIVEESECIKHLPKQIQGDFSSN